MTRIGQYFVSWSVMLFTYNVGILTLAHGTASPSILRRGRGRT